MTIEAIYENGVLKPKQPLALAEGAEVRLALLPSDQSDDDPLAAVIGLGDGPPDGADNHDKYIYGKDGHDPGRYMGLGCSGSQTRSASPTGPCAT